MTRTITVLIPTRNRADYLGAALASVNAAGEEAWRRFGARTTALVVDDESDDDGATRIVAERWGARYHRIDEHDGRHDPGVAIMTGLSMLDTDLYQLLGDDDVLLPHAISTCLSLVDEGADVVSTSFWRADENLVPTREIVLPQPMLGDLVRGYSTVCDGSVLRTDAVQGFELDASLRDVMLLPLWVQLMLDGRTFSVTPYPTWIYRRHGDNISGRITDEQRAARAQLITRLQDLVIERYGELPPSPRHEAKLKREAARRKREEAAALKATTPREPEPAASLAFRARRRLARILEP